LDVNIASWNLRYDSQPDDLRISESIARLADPLNPPSGAYYHHTSERPWSERRIPVANTLIQAGVDIIGIAETPAAGVQSE